MAAWFVAVVLIVLGWWSPWAALVNLALCRYFFIHMRWKGILRGMGAPGFMAYWTGLAVFLLEYTSRFAPDLRGVALLVLQVDLALIMLSAGVYKFTAGYPRNHGMELGLCNPMWGYWWKWYAARRPDSAVFWTMNQLAWGTEVVAAVLMLIPATRELGAVLLILSFLFILTQIRLGFLCEMVMVCGLLYVVPGGMLDVWIAAVAPAGAAALPATAPAVATLNGILRVALWTYLVLLPFAHAGLYYNFYAAPLLPAADPARARTLHQPVRHHHLARVLGGPGEFLHSRLARAARGRGTGAREPARRLAAIQPRRRDDLPDVALHDAEVLPEQRRDLPRAAAALRAHRPARRRRPLVFEYVSVVRRRDAFRLGHRCRLSWWTSMPPP